MTYKTFRKDGRDLDVWEVPVKAYVEAGPVSQEQIAKSRRIHAISVVGAFLSGKSPNPARLAEHTEAELEDAREVVWRIAHPGAWAVLPEDLKSLIRSGGVSTLSHKPVYEPTRGGEGLGPRDMADNADYTEAALQEAT